MPTNPLPYQCRTPGCTRKFEKPEHLRQHTKDSHPPSRPPPSRPPPSRSPPSRPTPSRPTPSRPPPKQQTFKCGAEGCERRAPFPQLSFLQQHTANAHSKSNGNTPSGLSTSAPVQRSTSAPVQRSTSAPVQRSTSSPSREHPIHVTNTRATRAPVLMTRHVPLYLPHASPYVYPPQPSTSTFLAAQNAVSSPDYTSVASDTQEELLQRLRRLELRQILINKSALKVGTHFVELAEDVIRSSANDRRLSFLDRLQERVEWMSKHNDVCSLAYSVKFRADVEMLLQDFGYNDSIKIQNAFCKDNQVISHLFREVIHSGKEEILHLSDEKVTGFMDALHKCIMASNDAPFVLPARRLLKNLCAATKAFPPTLFLELDSADTNQQIGRGGFADIFLGRYKGQDIALKRLQVYQSEPNEMSKLLKSLLQEVLSWVHLKHIYILPFFGLDEKTFDGYPPCIITPYMRNGTMNNFVKNRNGMLPDRRVDQLLFETAQGLAYLHSQNIVHGDLRGGNVLIDDDEHAQLADFGLAIVTDATLGTTSTTQRGSLRWMAPELHNYEVQFKRTEASDVYAFACLCIEIYTGEQPFWSIQQDMAVAFRVLDQKRPPRPSRSGPPDGTRAMSDGLWAIVEACWEHKPSDRPDMNKVLGLVMASP